MGTAVRLPRYQSPFVLLGPFLLQQLVVMRAFPEHFCAARRASLVLARDALAVCKALAALGANAAAAAAHVMSARLSHRSLSASSH